LKYDGKKESEGDKARVRMWINGEITIYTGGRVTLIATSGFMK